MPDVLGRPQRSRQELAALLRATGLRVTGQRVAVLATVFETPHLDVESIAASVRGGDLGKVSTQAVYDVLRALVAAGLVRRLEPAGSPTRYEARVGDNHHHLVCRDCGRVVDVDCATGSAPCLVASDSAGFAVDEAEVTYWGRCPDCTPDRNSRDEPVPQEASASSEGNR
jgi:Fur family ferric uptake transcriptional regulator